MTVHPSIRESVSDASRHSHAPTRTYIIRIAHILTRDSRSKRFAQRKSASKSYVIKRFIIHVRLQKYYTWSDGRKRMLNESERKENQVEHVHLANINITSYDYYGWNAMQTIDMLSAKLLHNNNNYPLIWYYLILIDCWMDERESGDVGWVEEGITWNAQIEFLIFCIIIINNCLRVIDR